MTHCLWQIAAEGDATDMSLLRERDWIQLVNLAFVARDLQLAQGIKATKRAEFKLELTRKAPESCVQQL